LKLSETISSFFDETISQLEADSASKVYSKYCDVLEEDKVYDLSQSLEEELISDEVNKRVVRKLFHSIVESFQNIRKHGLKSSDGTTFGAFILVEEETRFVVHFISAIPSMFYEAFMQSINFVNGMDKKALKAHYLQVLDKGKLSDKGGAGLGLMTIALKASGGILIDTKTHNEQVVVIKLSYDIVL